MNFSNTPFQDIKYMYDQRRMDNDRLLEARFKEVAHNIPEISTLHEQLIDLSIKQAKEELTHPENSEELNKIFKEKTNQLLEKKKQLLIEHGYPSDYLSPIYTCSDCKDTGLINGKPCHCLQQKQIAVLYENSNLNDILQKENFDTFNASYYDDTVIDSNCNTTARENIIKMRNQCKDYIMHFDEAYDNLLFYGPTGVGKTFLTHCIAKDLLDTGHTVIYLTSIQLFDILENGKFNREERSSFNEQIEYILRSDLLIIDDLGTELTNSFTSSQLYYFIEERHIRKRSTIISTNLSFQELRERYSERIFSRFTGYYNFCKIIGDDIRIKKI